MLLTVIIVTKNPGEDIYPTLASLKHLNDSSVEILLKDNSSDRELERVNESFDLPNFRYIHHEDNGVYDAMNQALELARGKFVYFLNAGDQLLNGKFLNTLKNADDEIGFFYGNMIFLYPFPRLIRYSKFINKYSVYLRRICHQAIIFRKEVFNKLVIPHMQKEENILFNTLKNEGYANDLVLQLVKEHEIILNTFYRIIENNIVDRVIINDHCLLDHSLLLLFGSIQCD